MKEGDALRNRLPLIIAIAGGLLVAAAGATYLFRMAPEGQATARVPVLIRDMPALTEITTHDLEWRTIPAGGFEPGAARDPGQVVGKISVVTLYRGQQIALNRLEDRTLLDSSRRVVAVNINLVRSGGGAIKPGDTVDVYWLGENINAYQAALTGVAAPAGKGSPAMGYLPGALLAGNATVLAIRDANGRDMGGQESPGVLSGTVAPNPAMPALAVLAVDAGSVAQVARGAEDGSKGIVLVKKPW